MEQQQTFEQITEQYEIEKELADKLRNASKEERRSLYSSVYDEFYQRVPSQQQLLRKSTASKISKLIRFQLRFLRKFLKKDTIFMEIGSGDCHLAFEVAKKVKKVFALDVSKEITENYVVPENYELVIYDGINIPLPENSIDIAYSMQLMEHLHPDDAKEQLQSIYKVLICGGKYICHTPNGLNGPHDVSKYFDDVATGFHLKEYTNQELSRLFKAVGFNNISTYVGIKGFNFRFPLIFVILFEKVLTLFSCRLRKKISPLLRPVLGIKMVGVK